ncbi:MULTISPECIES: serine dehydratase subunit alpha family protein [Alistipes]|uniref:L-cysteine desulfidase family protein n=1 Tax=Alistipes TaxID=239759 RepID=UPI00101D1113|nr:MULTISPECIES: L-serine ammonia-lyase, iron-sulfur-dependent, subunit alpha [Alistipes]MBR2217855.1 serine dehydratase subunit alpha family protein [Alistipes sp.]
MLSLSERRRIIDLINREVVPAIGCTEPIAVALCTARAAETLGAGPERIAVRLSANILKNAMGVGIPGTGMIGLPIAVALGALVGRSEYRLEVLRDVTPEAVERGREMIGRRCISIGLKEGVCEKLYIEAEVEAAGHRAVAVIAGGHTDFVFVSRDGEVLFDKRTPAGCDEEAGEVPLTLARVWDFAMTSPVEELRFILETRRLNMAAAERSLAGEYGHCVGRTLRCDRERKVMGDSLFTRILSYTSAACDARMAGAMIPVMSNSGSGNQGIAATLPVAVYADEVHASEEQTIRALALSHLTVIYIKQSLGRLSALCGCVVAATGSSCGITYLMGGGYEQAAAAVKNMIANLTGMICDGAKPSCAMKLTSGVSTAVLSAMMAMDGRCVSSVEGIIEEDVDRCIRNLTAIGREGMDETDRLVLRIMTNKC